jgi:hypothetical protein
LECAKTLQRWINKDYLHKELMLTLHRPVYVKGIFVMDAQNCLKNQIFSIIFVTMRLIMKQIMAMIINFIV